MYYSSEIASPFGAITLASDGENLCGLWLEGQKYHGGSIPGEMRKDGSLKIFACVNDWLERYFAGQNPDASGLPLAPVGGEFRQNVWRIISEVPYGQVFTYGGIAKKLASQMNKENVPARAVGGAVGHNPISIIIPCHRIVGANGSLTGYAGGLAKKIKLLELEGADMSRFHVPNA